MTLPNNTNFKSHFEDLLRHALRTLSAADLDINIELERPKQVSHGDYSCNLAMQLAKPLRKNPRDIATLLINAIPTSPHLEKILVAESGFINLFIKNTCKQQLPRIVLESGKKFG